MVGTWTERPSPERLNDHFALLYDFFLFDHMKEHFKRRSFVKEEEPLSKADLISPLFLDRDQKFRLDLLICRGRSNP
jgi:hypothetical protein